jgi:hypothetical protein
MYIASTTRSRNPLLCDGYLPPSIWWCSSLQGLLPCDVAIISRPHRRVQLLWSVVFDSSWFAMLNHPFYNGLVYIPLNRCRLHGDASLIYIKLNRSSGYAVIKTACFKSTNKPWTAESTGMLTGVSILHHSVFAQTIKLVSPLTS